MKEYKNNISMEAENVITLNPTSLPTLESIQYDLFIQNIVPMVFLVLIGTVGTISNLHVIIVNFLRVKQSNHRTTILFLAVLDFFVDVIVVPMGLYHLRYQLETVNFNCTMFLPSVLCGSSSCILLVIAIERYRKVCAPLKRQFAVNEIRLMCFLTLIVFVFLALPTLFFYGAKDHYSEKFKRNISTCSVMMHEDQGRSAVTSYSTIYLTLVLVLAVSCGVCYTAIGRFVMKRRNKIVHQTHSNNGTLKSITKHKCTEEETTIIKIEFEGSSKAQGQNDESEKNAGITNENKSHNVLIETIKRSFDGSEEVRRPNVMEVSTKSNGCCYDANSMRNSVVDPKLTTQTMDIQGSCKVKREHDMKETTRWNGNSDLVESVNTVSKLNQEEKPTISKLKIGKIKTVQTAILKNNGKQNYKKYNKSLRLTLMFLIATILNFLCFIVNVVFVCLENHDKTHNTVQDILGPDYWILRKFVNVGTVINPFVYGFFDPFFRKTCLAFYTSVIKRLRCTIKTL